MWGALGVPQNGRLSYDTFANMHWAQQSIASDSFVVLFFLLAEGVPYAAGATVMTTTLVPWPTGVLRTATNDITAYSGKRPSGI